MAIKSQLRVQQLTGSIIDLTHSGSNSSAANPVSIADGDLGAVLGQFAGAIGRISGKTGNTTSGFTNASEGTFYTDLKSDSAGNIDIGSTTDADKFGNIFVGDTKGLQIGLAEEHKILDGNPGLLIDSTQIIEVNSSAGAISIGNDDIDQAINIGTQGERTISIGTGAFAGAVNLGNGTGDSTVDIKAGTAGITIGTNAIAHTVYIGNETGASALDLDAGTGGVAIDAQGAGAIAIGTQTDTGVINVGTGASARTISVGNETGATALDFDAGTGGVAIDAQGAGTIAIGTQTDTGAINVGVGASARVITVGNVTGATQVVLNAGTAGIALASTGAGDITINSDDTLLLDSDGVLELNTSGGAINIGTDGVAVNTTLGNVTGTTALALNSGTGGIALASTGAGDVTIDSDDTLLLDSDGVLELNSSAGAINIGDDAVAQKISIGGDVATRTEVELNALLVDINAGTSGLTMNAAGASNLVTSAGALTITSDEAATWSTVGGKLTIKSGDAGEDIGLAGQFTTLKGKLNVDQAATFDSSVSVSGDFFVAGTTTTVSSSNMVVKDPIAAFGVASSSVSGGGVPTFGEPGDRGFVFPMRSAWAGSPVLFWDHTSISSGVPTGYFKASYANSSGSAQTITAAGNLPLMAKSFYVNGDSEYISSDGTDMTLTAAADIKLSAAAYVEIPSGIGLSFNGTTQTAKITNNGQNLDINTPGKVVFNPGGNEILPNSDNATRLGSDAKSWSDIHVQGNAYVTGAVYFADLEAYIKHDGTDLKIADNADINLVAGADVLLDAGGDVILDPAGDSVFFKENGTLRGEINVATAAALLFKDSAGSEIFRLDGAQNSMLMAGSTKIMFADTNSYVNQDGTDLQLVTTTDINLKPAADLLVDAGGDIILDAAGDSIYFKEGGTTRGEINVATAGDLIFKDAGAAEIFRIDGSEDSLLMATSKKIQFRDTGLHIQSPEDGHLYATADIVLGLSGSTTVGIKAGTLDIDSANWDASHNDVDLDIKASSANSLTVDVAGTRKWGFDTSANIFHGQDGVAIGVGTGKDLYMSHNGTKSTLTNETGNFMIENKGSSLVISSSAASSVLFFGDGYSGAEGYDGGPIAGNIALAGSGEWSTFISNFSDSTSIIGAINSNASGGSRDKDVVDVSSTATQVTSTLAGFGQLSPAKLDVYLNGQLMASGSSGSGGDYNVSADTKVTFTFNVEPDDVVTFIKP